MMTYISIGRDVFANGYLKRWKLRLFGTPISPDMFLRRHRLVMLLCKYRFSFCYDWITICPLLRFSDNFAFENLIIER